MIKSFVTWWQNLQDSCANVYSEKRETNNLQMIINHTTKCKDYNMRIREK